MILKAPWLFGIAALFNFAVGLAFLFARPVLTPLLQLEPVTGSNLVLLYMLSFIIVFFGILYAMIARDPVRYRSFIGVSAIGKLTAVAGATLPWLMGEAPGTLAMLVSGDLLFAGLFWLYLKQTR